MYPSLRVYVPFHWDTCTYPSLRYMYPSLRVHVPFHWDICIISFHWDTGTCNLSFRANLLFIENKCTLSLRVHEHFIENICTGTLQWDTCTLSFRVLVTGTLSLRIKIDRPLSYFCQIFTCSNSVPWYLLLPYLVPMFTGKNAHSWTTRLCSVFSDIWPCQATKNSYFANICWARKPEW